MTIKRYLEAQRPFLNDEEFAETKCKAEAFLEGEGVLLDKKLREMHAKTDNSAICSQWTERYWHDRRNIVFLYNGGAMLAYHESEDMATAAARMVVATMRYFCSLRDGKLRPEMYAMNPSLNLKESVDKIASGEMEPGLSSGILPLVMHQHMKLFQTMRIPQENIDTVKNFPNTNHIAVIFRGHFYTFTALDKNGKLFPPTYYYKVFQSIIDGAPLERSAGLGLLTTRDRDAWAENRQYACTLGDNAESMELIGSAITLICLDEDWTFSEDDPISTTKNMVFGHDPTNRWFDKSMSLMVSANGYIAFNMEHSWGDLGTVVQFFRDISEDLKNNKYVSNTEAQNGTNLPNIDITEHVRKLPLVVDPYLENAIEAAQQEFDTNKASLTFVKVITYDLGREALSNTGLKADGVMQMGVQAAFNKVTGSWASLWESCSMSRYKHGRTEAVHPLTVEMKAFVEAFNDASRRGTIKEEVSLLMSLLMTASDKHRELVKLAHSGNGWNRHLCILRHLCVKSGQPLPPIFQVPRKVPINGRRTIRLI